MLMFFNKSVQEYSKLWVNMNCPDLYMSGRLVYVHASSKLTPEFDTLDVEERREIYDFIRKSFKVFDRWMSQKYPSLANNIDPDRQTMHIFKKTYGTRTSDVLTEIGATGVTDV